MGKEYIEKQAVEDMIENAHIISEGEYCGYCTEDIDINSIPAADVVPVVHGKWIMEAKDDFEDTMKKCSICGYPVSVYWGHSKFCPNCGAKMDKED